MDLEKFKTGSLFWIIYITLSIIGLIYLMIWSYHTNNLRGMVVAVIFAVMVLSSIVITKFEVFMLDLSFRASCFWFALFFTIFQVLGFVVQNLKDTKLSVASEYLTMGKSTIFASISSELPIFWKFVIDNITIPTSEEMLWLIALPVVIYWIFNIIGESYPWVANKVFILFMMIIVSSVTFALFHVGKLVLAFALGAMLFRAIMVTFYWGEELMDVFPGVKILPSAVLGAHIGLNWSQDGFFHGLQILSTEVYGCFLLLLFFIVFIISISVIIEYIMKPFRASS